MLLLDTTMFECPASFKDDLRIKLFLGQIRGVGCFFLFFFFFSFKDIIFLLSVSPLLLLLLEITVFYF